MPDGKDSGHHLYILSGGSGTRLWPLSREAQPKQFYDLTGSGHSLLVDTALRLKPFGEIKVITTEALRILTLSQLSRAGLGGRAYGEPVARNTAAAVALAARLSLLENPKALVGVFPADHAIQNASAFSDALTLAFREAGRGRVVTLGITPTYPATAYGYMELKESLPRDGVLRAIPVARFIEKPTEARAAELLATGRFVWNAGIFVFQAARMGELFREHMPELWTAMSRLKPDLSNFKEIYEKLPSLSVDYGVMERMTDLLCVAGAELAWSDVGSWEEVSRVAAIARPPLEVESRDNFYTGHTPVPKRAVFVGCQDLLVVDTPDALLVTKRGSGQLVRNVVEQLKKTDPVLTRSHQAEERPWGRFEVLMDTEHFKSKRISVWAGQRLSYQSHEKRAEHWVVVKGVATVTLNDAEHSLKAGDHIFIPLRAKHRIQNTGTETLEFIEVQCGTYFGEDDIQRYQDDYGR